MFCLLLGKGEKSGSVGGTFPIMEIGSLLSCITRGSAMDLSSFLQQLAASGGHLQVPQDAAGCSPQTDVSSLTNNNPSFNEVLFRKYKSLKVNSKPIQSCDIRNKINSRELSDLPPSKVDQKPMCLAWHTKAMYNANCLWASDHVDYINSGYQPICGWCETNYLNPQEG